LYGRSLGSLVPLLRTCDRFRLTAEAALRGRDLIVTLRSGDPIFPGLPTPSRYDSQLEERFAREFRRVAPDWDLIREPEPLRAGNHLIFPDFAIFHRRNRARCALLEIVGFWTPRYLRSKLERLRDAGAPSLILCIDESLNCAGDALPESAHIIRYKRHIDAAAVLGMVEAMTSSRDPGGRWA
jgi:predicted nuclease of restriction endonuclease-like RecB superfamily